MVSSVRLGSPSAQEQSSLARPWPASALPRKHSWVSLPRWQENRNVGNGAGAPRAPHRRPVKASPEGPRSPAAARHLAECPLHNPGKKASQTPAQLLIFPPDILRKSEWGPELYLQPLHHQPYRGAGDFRLGWASTETRRITFI